jgi:1,5-anhydro-D-fructose reductase (1,5-anhydro-D-mannitol-forming)
MEFGWGIVGTGRHADAFMAPAIAAVEGSRLVGVVSRDQRRAEEFAERHGAIHAYTRYEDLLANPEIDIVLVATPNSLHGEQVVAAARAGKHVLCEKPLAISVQEAAHAVEECQRAGVRLGIDFQMRHVSSSQECRRLIASGAIGNVLVVQAEHSPGDNGLRGWRTDPTLAGLGSVFNIGVHTYDLIRYLVGSEVTEVMAMFDADSGTRLETLAMTVFRFANGTMAYVNANQVVPLKQNDFVIYGTEGRIIGRNLSRHMMDGELRVIVSKDGEEDVRPHSTHDAYERVIADMNDAIVAGREPLASGWDGLRSLQLTEAIARAAQEGRTVMLEYELPR